MIEHFTKTIQHLTREDWRIILSILSLVIRIIFKVVCFYQEKQYYGKRVIKKQTKIDYKLIFDLIDLIIRLARWLY
jgi:hypothetical protein